MEEENRYALHSNNWSDSFDKLNHSFSASHCDSFDHFESTDKFQTETVEQFFTIDITTHNNYLFEPVKIERDIYLPLSFQSGSGLERKTSRYAKESMNPDLYCKGKKTMYSYHTIIHLTDDGILRIFDEQGDVYWSMEHVADFSKAIGRWVFYLITFDRKLYRVCNPELFDDDTKKPLCSPKLELVCEFD